VPVLANAYTFAASTGASLASMTGATQVLLSGNDDTPTAAPANIGFTFNFNNTNYTQYSVSPDGWILLGSGTAASSFTNGVTLTSNIPKIYPYWDDLATGTDGNVRTLVTGTAPNRIFVVQWFVTIPRVTTGPANATFQAWLYENGGKIEYRYGTMGAGAMTASVGMTAGATNFQSITLGSPNTVSTVAANNNIAGQPASGQMFSFNQPSTPVTYSWSPSTFLSATNIANPVATAVTSTTAYTATIIGSGGCTTTAPATVTVGGPPATTISAGTFPNACINAPKAIIASTAGGGAPYVYTWYNGTAGNYTDLYSNAAGTTAYTGTNIATVYYNPTTLTGITVGVDMVDACSATSSATYAISVNALPSVAISTTPASAAICGGTGNVALLASGAATYSWTPATGLDNAAVANPTATPAATTMYTVTGTDVNGCVSTATRTVGVGPNITATATATPAAVCIGSNTTLAAVGSAGAGVYCGASVSQDGFSTSNEYLSLVTFNTISNASTSSTTPVAGYVDYTATVSTTVAAGTSYPIGATVTNFFTGDQAVAWVDFDQSGTFDAAEQFTLAGGASGTPFTGSILIPVAALNGATRLRVRVNFTGLTPACGSTTYGEVEDYTVIITGGIDPFTYVWSPATFLGGTTSGTVTATAVTAATTYTVTTTSGAGCTTTNTVPVTINARPTAAVSGGGTACAGATLPNVSVALTGASPWAVTYSDGTTTNTAVGVTASPFVITGATAGTYTVTALTDANCASIATDMTGSASVIVNPLPVITASVTTPIACFGGNGIITVSASGATAPYTGEGTFLVATGTYSYAVTDANTCSATSSVVTVSEPTAVSASSMVTTPVACNGGNAIVTVTGSGGTGAYTGEGTFSVAAGTYSYTIMDANNCAAATSGTVTEPAALVLSSTVVNVCTPSGLGNIALSATGGTAPHTFSMPQGPYFTVDHGTKTAAHPYFGVGSTIGYTIDDIEGRELTLVRGTTYTFDLASVSASHPFYLTNSAVGGGGGVGTQYTTPASGSIITFTPTMATPNLIYYQCANHSNMGWEINVVDLTTPTFTNLMPGDYTALVTDGNGCTTNEATAVLLMSTASATVTAAPGTVYTATTECTDGAGWTHYYAGSGDILLSLEKNGQAIGTVGVGGFTVLAGTTPAYGSNSGALITAPYATNPGGWYVMNRYWRVTGASQPTAPIRIRSYYTATDVSDVVNTPGLAGITSIQNMTFYKINDGAVDPNPAIAGGQNSATAGEVDGFIWSATVPASFASGTFAVASYNNGNYAEHFIRHFSGGGGGGGNGGVGFPVEWLDFSATLQNNRTNLDWATASERNVDRFVVERSIDGATFIEIGEQAAVGNSGQVNRYQAVDPKPLIGRNVYRIKSIDIDGALGYTEVREVLVGDQSALSIYPNPTTDVLHLSFVGAATKVRVEIYNTAGQKVLEEKLTDSNLQTIDLSGFKAGVYTFKVVTSLDVFTGKVTKMN